MRVRLRGPTGVSTATFDDTATVADLLAEIQSKTAVTHCDVKYGYPPQPLELDNGSILLKNLPVRLNGEQLIISATTRSAQTEDHDDGGGVNSWRGSNSTATPTQTQQPFSFSGISSTPKHHDPIPLKRKTFDMEVPELPMPHRTSTLGTPESLNGLADIKVLRVMPDDNSCLFRALGHAVIPGDHESMYELRSLVAQVIQGQPDLYTKAILEKPPDDYCRWIQTENAWGGGIELSILSKHFDIEICSIDVQSLRVDRFNEGGPRRCILVYSGIHYDCLVENPSDYPFTRANAPPELDVRMWDASDDDIIIQAVALCGKLKALHYYTDTAGMSIKCNTCGWVGSGEKEAAVHAQTTGHYDMSEG